MVTYNGITPLSWLYLIYHADGHRVVQNTEPPAEPESSSARAARIRNFLEAYSATPYKSIRFQADRYLVHPKLSRNLDSRMYPSHF